jgi:hypothetical protein
MSGYIVEEPNEIPIYYTFDNEEIIQYWKVYSVIQRKRFLKVLHQMKDIWCNVYDQMNFLRLNISIEESNIFMDKIHRIFLINQKEKLDYYSDEKIRFRKNKDYVKKKILKLKNMIKKI